MKIKWEVAPKPTGRYRSFEDRGWPTAHDSETGEYLASIVPVEYCSYDPWSIKHNGCPLLKVNVAIRNRSLHSFERKTMVGRFNSIPEAKEAFKQFVKKYPHYFVNMKLPNEGAVISPLIVG